MKIIRLLVISSIIFFSCSKNSDDTIYSPIPPNEPTPSQEVIPEFLPNLSEIHLFTDNLNDLIPSDRAFIYDINTALFSDYAYKQRVISLPAGTAMTYIDNGFPTFPNNTVIAKTFYYLNNENDASQGKQLIETRIIIKKNGVWELGNYKWNAQQTEAVLDNTKSTVSINYLNKNGAAVHVNYVIPSHQQCIECHSTSHVVMPIGPKLRALNGNNQLEHWISKNYISNLTNVSQVTVLPDWEDAANFTLEERARAYFDMNCAHCHSQGAFCADQSNLRLAYDTPFSVSYILDSKNAIDFRMSMYSNGISMPLTGTTMMHPEGYDLIREYLNTL
ncbi:MAG: hypothetical protein ABI295_01730 [Xanthomarina sp.]